MIIPQHIFNNFCIFKSKLRECSINLHNFIWLITYCNTHIAKLSFNCYCFEYNLIYLLYECVIRNNILHKTDKQLVKSKLLFTLVAPSTFSNAIHFIVCTQLYLLADLTKTVVVYDIGTCLKPRNVIVLCTRRLSQIFSIKFYLIWSKLKFVKYENRSKTILFNCYIMYNIISFLFTINVSSLYRIFKCKYLFFTTFIKYIFRNCKFHY